MNQAGPRAAAALNREPVRIDATSGTLCLLSRSIDSANVRRMAVKVAVSFFTMPYHSIFQLTLTLPLRDVDACQPT